MWKEINRLRPLFSRRDKFHYVLLLAMMGVASVLDVVGVGAIPAFIATLAVPDQVLEYPVARDVLPALGITTPTQLVIWGCIALMVVFVIKNGYLALVYYMQIRITERHRVRLSDELFSAYMYAPYEFHLSRNSAELLRNVQTETREIITGIINPILTFTMNALMTIGIVALLIATMPPIILSAVAFVGGTSALFLRISKKRMKQYGQEAKYERKEAIRAVNQGLSSFVDARILGREGFFLQAFHRSMAHFALVDRLRQFISKSAPLILETVAVLGLLLIVIMLALGGGDMISLVPMLALFAAAVVRLRASIGTMVGNVSQMQYSVAAVPLVVDELKLLSVKDALKSIQRRRKSVASDRVPIPFEDAIALEDVGYTYPGASQPALHGISLSIPRGSSVAFVGSTGSGKTTLINVILGLLRPQQGRIAVDGADIHEDIARWHASIGYIPQTIYLLDDTLRQNIVFGLPDESVDEDRLWQAIDAAQLGDYVRGLDAQLDTVVGERGVRISGGQRQRVGLARAFYNNPSILMMDEATSALDNETESAVMQALRAAKGDRTIIMIAHRLSTVRDCDCLYFLKDGRAEAKGTFDELAAVHRDFKRMSEVA